MHPRPRSRLLTAHWRYIALLNYRVDAAVLAPLVPAGTELDLWQGHAYASVVGFMFDDMRVLGVPAPFCRSFEEVNLRFYVRRHVDGSWRRAVTFIREFVPSRVIATAARWLYNENYTAAPMRHSLDMRGDGAAVSYSWCVAGVDGRLSLETESPFREMVAGSEQEFIAEHYFGYATQRDGGTLEYEVDHPRWLIAPATRASLDCDVGALYGAPFVEALSAEPSSAFLAAGSRVEVYNGARIAP